MNTPYSKESLIARAVDQLERAKALLDDLIADEEDEDAQDALKDVHETVQAAIDAAEDVYGPEGR